MLENESGYTLEDLVRESGLAERNIRYYIAQKVVLPPSSRGSSARYTEEHLLQLKLVKQLKDRMSLSDVRDQLKGRSLQELQILLAEEQRRTEETQSPKDFLATLLAAEPPTSPMPVRDHGPSLVSRPEPWLRLRLADGVELHLTPQAHERLQGVLGKISRLVNS